MDFNLFETPNFEESDETEESGPAWADLDMLVAPPAPKEEPEEEPDGNPWDDLGLLVAPPEGKEDEPVPELELEVELTPETAEMFGIEPEEEPEEDEPEEDEPEPEPEPESESDEREVLTFSKEERKQFNHYARPPRVFRDPISKSKGTFDELPFSEKQAIRCEWLLRHRKAMV